MKDWIKSLVVCLLAGLVFVLGHDSALTMLARDMHAGKTTIRDNRLVMEIRSRRLLRSGQ